MVLTIRFFDVNERTDLKRTDSKYCKVLASLRCFVVLTGLLIVLCWAPNPGAFAGQFRNNPPCEQNAFGVPSLIVQAFRRQHVVLPGSLCRGENRCVLD